MIFLNRDCILETDRGRINVIDDSKEKMIDVIDDSKEPLIFSNCYKNRKDSFGSTSWHICVFRCRKLKSSEIKLRVMMTGMRNIIVIDGGRKNLSGVCMIS